jgi:hypothetical protein
VFTLPGHPEPPSENKIKILIIYSLKATFQGDEEKFSPFFFLENQNLLIRKQRGKRG